MYSVCHTGQACVQRIAFRLSLTFLLAVGAASEEANPACAEHVTQAIHSMKGREWSKAENFLSKCLQISPSDLPAQYWQGYLLFQTGRYGESASVVRKYIEQKPNNSDARKILGLDLFMQGEHEAAQAELDRASQLAPADSEAVYYLGRVYFTRHNLPAARAAFEKVVQLDGNSVRGHNHLGQTYEALGRFEAAREAYRKAIELERQQSTKSEWPYFNLGVLCRKEGELQAAALYLREAVLRNPAWSEGKVQLAMALFSSNQFKEAGQILSEVIQADPGNADAHYQMGRLLTKLGKGEEARRHFQAFESLRKP